jgi:hypothetical protein
LQEGGTARITPEIVSAKAPGLAVPQSLLPVAEVIESGGRLAYIRPAAQGGKAAMRIRGASTFRTFILLPMVLGYTSIAVCAQDARQMTCTGTMIEPNGNSLSPKTVNLNLELVHKVTLDLGQGAMNVRVVSDNKIQLKFRTKDFEGEYFHYTGDLFFIYKSGHLMRLTCQKKG